jgi:hypothetical protein
MGNGVIGARFYDLNVPRFTRGGPAGAEIGIHPDSLTGSSVFISTGVPADLRPSPKSDPLPPATRRGSDRLAREFAFSVTGTPRLG